jgi:hypothetical protein
MRLCKIPLAVEVLTASTLSAASLVFVTIAFPETSPLSAAPESRFHLRVQANAPPVVSGHLVGSREIVFDTSEACEQVDIPDAPARAFRDRDRTVHLIATHYVARAMVGPNLNEVKHDCRVIYRSPFDPDPSHFQDASWLTSFYTQDGQHIAALVHSEYHGSDINGTCATPREPLNCWWNTITAAFSSDAGYTFAAPSAPSNLVASLPYKYTVGNRAGAYGYQSPTNMIAHDGWIFALINAWPYKDQEFGPCLLRTKEPFDPSSWRAWDGANFGVRFIDPYRHYNGGPASHICRPVLTGEVTSFAELEDRQIFIAVQYTPDARFGPKGLYLNASRDLIHWSEPELVVTTDDMLKAEGQGRWSYGYFSVLDPTSKDPNFSTLSNSPYVYFVRLDAIQGNFSRTLFRQRLALEYRIQ